VVIDGPVESSEETLPEELPTEDAEAEEGEPEYDEDEPNLVPIFMKNKKGKEALKKISKQVDEDFTSGWDASENYRERFSADMSIYTGELPPKSGPFKYSANTHLPVMSLGLQRIVVRSSAEVFGDWTQPITVAPCSSDFMAVMRSQAMTKHDTYQLTEQMPEFRRQMERAFLLFYMAGDATTRSYRDEFRQRNAHETLSCEEFIVPYVYTSVYPDYSDCPWRVQVLKLYRHELQAYDEQWFDVEKVLDKEAPSWEDEPEQHFREAMGEREGIVVPDDDSKAPYKILLYEGWCSALPGQERDRFIQAIVDSRTKAVLSLRIHEEPPRSEVERYERQVAELEQYDAAVAAHEQEEMVNTMIRKGLEGSGIALHPSFAGQLAPKPAPPPPQWVGDQDPATVTPEPPRKQPIHMYTHWVNMEPIVGNLGLGHGRQQADFNRAANIAMQQFTDIATAANAGGWMVDESAVETERPLTLEPMKFHKVKTIGNKSLKDSVMPLRSDSANPQLMEVVRLMLEQGQQAAQAPEIFSGEPGKSGETYRGVQARIEQANKQLSVPTRAAALSVKHVLKNNARLNAIYLDEEAKVSMLNPLVGQAETITVRREWYELDYHVKIRGDLRFVTQSQRVAEADEVLMMPKAIPALAQNLHFQWHAAKRALEERGRFDMIPSLGPEPPPPKTAFGIMPAPPMAPSGSQPNAPPPRGRPARAGGPPGQPTRPAGPQVMRG
jgi:hypothetical protein